MDTAESGINAKSQILNNRLGYPEDEIKVAEGNIGVIKSDVGRRGNLCSRNFFGVCRVCMCCRKLHESSALLRDSL